MDYIKLFKTNKKAFLIGIVATVVFIILFISQAKRSSSAVPQPSFKMDEHIAQTVQFSTDVIGSRDRTEVSIPFSFKDDPFPIVLAYELEDQTMKEFLIFHPQLSFLNWDAIVDGEITLYQKVREYDSLVSLLENPTGNIAAENSLKESFPQLNADLIHFSNDVPIDLEKYDYILSTQTNISQVNSIYYYKNIIDTSDALLDENNQITWAVRAPDADEDHRFYLGNNIEIVYLQ